MKRILIVTSILLLAGAGYFTYEKWVKHSNLTLWSFVLSDAFLVIEATMTEDITQLKSYPIWNVMEASSDFKNFHEGLSFLDSINGEGGFSAIFKKIPILTSVHKVSTSGIDFLFIAQLQNISQNTFSKVVIKRLKEQGYRFKTRNFTDFKISEISHGGKIFTFIFYKNFFLGSFTPYLVEDAIRTISDSDILSFKEKFTHLNTSKTRMDPSFYLNFEKTGDLLNTMFTTPPLLPLMTGNYALTMDSSIVQWSGFTDATEGRFSTHTDHQPSTFDMVEIVPENTAYFHHITSSDFAHWKTRHLEYLRAHDLKAKALQDSLERNYDFSVDQLFDLIDSEIGMAHLESTKSGDEQKLMILKVKDRKETLAFFTQLTQRIALKRKDAVYADSYSENEIRFLPIQNFPSAILGDLTGAFEQCFYMSHKNYLIFSNDLQQLKGLITSIREENTWGKSIRVNSFLRRIDDAANVSFYINIPKTWNSFIHHLKPHWAEHFKKNTSTYRSIELAALQFSYLDGRFFTNYTITQPIEKPKEIPQKRPDRSIRFTNRLISKPYLLKTHAYGNLDMIVQDNTSTIHYLDSNQKILWTKKLDGPIQGEIYPIDYYKNGKIQYLLATHQNVHMIDRTGSSIPHYPKTLPNAVEIHHINLIDYNLNRNYRIGITDADGNIYLTDKNLNPLDNWSPRNFNRPALLPLVHHRLKRKDVMISLQENGKINVMNRRGEFIRGFPFDAKKSLHKNYFMHSSNSLANSSLTVISTDGELMEINLEGKVIKQDQLIKTSVDAVFGLIPDINENSFIIVRKEKNSYAVFDETGTLLFQKNHSLGETILIQYYQFGAGKDLIILTDKQNKLLYVYDKSGRLITDDSLNSEHEVSLIYSSKKTEFQIFTSSDAHLEFHTFDFTH